MVNGMATRKITITLQDAQIQEIQSLVEKHQTDIQQSANPLNEANPPAAALFDILVKPAVDLISSGSRIGFSAIAYPP